MRRLNTKRQGYRKYLFLYLIVFLLPVTVTLLYFYPEVARSTQKRALAAANHSLALLKNSVDAQLQMISSYPAAIQNDPDITTQMLQNADPWGNYRLQQELKKIAGTNIYFEKILLYNRQNGIYYGIDTLYTSQDMNREGHTFYYDNWDREDSLAYYMELERMDIRRAEPVFVNQVLLKDVITISVPIPAGNPDAGLVLIVLVREKKLFAELTEAGSGNSFVILDSANRLIASSAEEAFLSDEELKLFLENESGGEELVLVKEGRKYFISMMESGYYDMKYVSILDRQMVLGEIAQVSRNTLWMLALLLMGGVAVIWTAAHISYQPLELLNRSIQKNREQLRSYFFAQCLGGVFADNMHLLKQAQECGLIFYSQACCIVCREPVTELVKEAESETEVIKDLPDGLAAYWVQGLAGDEQVLILTFEQRDVFRTWGREFRGRFAEVGFTWAGIGRIGEPSELHTSYILGMAAAEYAAGRKQSPIAVYDEMEVRRMENLDQVFETGRLLEFAIMRRKLNGIEGASKQFKRSLESIRSAEEIYRVIYMNNYNMLVRELNCRGEQREYIYALPEHKKPDYEGWEQKFMQLSQDLLQRITKEVSVQEQSTDIQAILDYLQEQCGEYDLTLQSAAEHFHMTYSNLSHYFKHETGMNFSAWLERIRMEQARAYLESTADPLERVAERVGYATANGFSRVFKKHCGMTPGEYRRKYRI